MAGTNQRSNVDGIESDWPVIILVDPQLGENIGTAARAMLNCGLTNMRIVRPRDGWPNPRAVTTSSGAGLVLERAQLYDTTIEATRDLDLVFATTSRERDLAKTVLTPCSAGERLVGHIANGGRPGILFGPERAGLINDDIVLANAIIEVPLNPAFASLNLAQAVLLVGYQWLQARSRSDPPNNSWGNTPLATIEQREYFYERLERELQKAGFLFPENLSPSIKRNLRVMFNRAGLTDQEVRTLHGVLTALTNPDTKRNRNRKDR